MPEKLKINLSRMMGLFLNYIKSGVAVYQFRRLILGTKFVYKDDVGTFDYLSNGSITEILYFLDYVLDRDCRQKSFAKSSICSLGCDGSKDITAYKQLAVVESHFHIVNMKVRNFVLGLTRVRRLFFTMFIYMLM
jgi:hypothetical protein